MIRKILASGDPILRRKSKAVTKIDKKVLSLIQDLKDTLAVQKEPEGVGLAAPQIGKNLQIFLANYKTFERVVINPKIISKVEKVTKQKSNKIPKEEILEGCLSLPNYYGPLKRSPKVKIEYKNEKGEKVTESFSGFEAQIILHEIDHLNGVLFVDRLLEAKKPLYKLNGKEWEEFELV